MVESERNPAGDLGFPLPTRPERWPLNARRLLPLLILTTVALAGMVPLPCAISLGDGPSRSCVVSEICLPPEPGSDGACSPAACAPAARAPAACASASPCGAAAAPGPAAEAPPDAACGGPGQDADCASCVLCVCGISVLGAPVTLTAHLQDTPLPAADPAEPAARGDRPPAPPPRSC